MPKYQNVSDFRQSLVIQGSRTLLRPGDVISSDRELQEVFLQKVADDTPVTVTEGRRIREVDRIAAKLSELEKEKENLAAAKASDVEENVGALTAQMNDLRTDVFEEIQGTQENVKALRDMYTTQKQIVQELKDEFKEEMDIINRRLGILKSAMMTMEEEIYGPMEEPEGN